MKRRTMQPTMSINCLWFSLFLLSWLPPSSCVHVKTHAQPITHCVDQLSSPGPSINIDCLPINFIYILVVEVGRTHEKNATFCEAPHREKNQCVMRANIDIEAHFKRCGAMSVCSVELDPALDYGSGLDGYCWDKYQGDTYIILSYLCRARMLVDGSKPPFITMGDSPWKHHPGENTVYILTPNYGELTNVPRAACGVAYLPDGVQSTEPYKIVLEVYDFYSTLEGKTNTTSEAACHYQLHVFNSLGEKITTDQHCPERHRPYIYLDLTGVHREHGYVQVDFRSQNQNASGRLWIKAQVQDENGSEVTNRGVSVSCSPIAHFKHPLPDTSLPVWVYFAVAAFLGGLLFVTCAIMAIARARDKRRDGSEGSFTSARDGSNKSACTTSTEGSNNDVQRDYY